MREGLLMELCLEVAKGDLASERFRDLWIESGINLDGEEFEIANRILVRAQEMGIEIPWKGRSLH
jgi:hypothetical protein